MNNISNIKNCYGCGVCTSVCPKNIISIELNNEGFYEPRLTHLDKCTECGLCLSVCAYTHDDLALEKPDKIDGYAAWSNDERVRRKCSSGGIGFELGKQLIEKGYKACGVRYNTEKERAEHYIATTVEEFIPSIGSKYIQSYTPNAFSAFSKDEKYLVTGTPCQIDSLRRYFRLKKMEDKVVLMDFFCHGVPSMLLWKKYLQKVEKITGKVTYVSWRNKQTGWHDSWAMGIDGEANGTPVNWHDSYNLLIKGKKHFLNSRLSQGDVFYKMFLDDSCLGRACYEKCKYKALASSADIRIGDLWGKNYQHDEKGVSGALVFTEKGRRVMNGLKNVTLIDSHTDIVTEGQIKKRIKMPYSRSSIISLLRSDVSLNKIHNLTKLLRIGKILKFRIKRVLNKQ